MTGLRKGGAKCSICPDKAIVARIREMRERKPPVPVAAIAIGVRRSLATVTRHLKQCPGGEPGRLPALVSAAPRRAPPPMPPLAADAAPRERAANHCAWLRARIEHAEQSDATPKELSSLAGQLTNAMRLHARLSGALDVTESQVARSAPFARLVVVIRDALARHPRALEDVMQAIEAFESGEAGPA